MIKPKTSFPHPNRVRRRAVPAPHPAAWRILAGLAAGAAAIATVATPDLPFVAAVAVIGLATAVIVSLLTPRRRPSRDVEPTQPARIATADDLLALADAVGVPARHPSRPVAYRIGRHSGPGRDAKTVKLQQVPSAVQA